MYAGRRKILIHVEYQGTLLNGFQMQTSALPSVQEDLEVAIFRLTGQWKRVFSASRTDAGVHARDMVGQYYFDSLLISHHSVDTRMRVITNTRALAQICCFNTDSDIPADDFAVGLTNRLSSDICVFDSHETHSEFDPRASIRKKYKYLIACSSTRPSIGREQVYHHASASKAKLNVDAMIMAAVSVHESRTYVTRTLIIITVGPDPFPETVRRHARLYNVRSPEPKGPRQ